MALHCTGDYTTYDDAFNTAVESLESGKAYSHFKKLIALQ
jgi:anthranilate phosphoribosyltransferase